MPATLLDAKTVPQFQNTLPNLLTPGLFIDARNRDSFNITMKQGSHNFGLGLPLAEAWGYHSSAAPLWDLLGLNYLGPTIVAREGKSISINWENYLPEQHLLNADMTMHGADHSLMGGVHAQPHVHGGLTVASSDGNPFATPAFRGSSRFNYRNVQDAGTIWYHDHALGITRLNVYAGLAGFYLIRDDEDTGVADNPTTPDYDGNPLGLPANFDPGTPGTPGDDLNYEFPIVIQDKNFDNTGKLYYPAIPGDPLPGPGNRTVAPVPGIAPNGTPNPFPGAPTSPTMVPESAGNVMIVNGVAWPKLDVEPRTYRFRLLNGSDSRFYELQLPGSLDFQVIGSDNGLLDGPAVPVRRLPIAPGERYDVIIDFSRQAGKTLTLNNVAGGNGSRPIFNDPQTTGQIMQFNVLNVKPSIPEPVNPQWKRDLRPSETLPVWTKNANGTWSSNVGTTTAPGDHALAIFEGLDEYGRIFPHLGTVNQGSLLWDDPNLGGVMATAAETVKADEYTLFEIYNTTPDAHPIHLHGTEFQILERQRIKPTLVPKFIDTDLLTAGGLHQGSAFDDTNRDGVVNTSDITLLGRATPAPAYEKGFKDTAIVNPGERILVVAKYDSALLNDPIGGAAGKYVWHCHILSHEDHEMMRPLQVM